MLSFYLWNMSAARDSRSKQPCNVTASVSDMKLMKTRTAANVSFQISIFGPALFQIMLATSNQEQLKHG